MLQRALADPGEFVAVQACAALGELEDPGAVEALLGALEHPRERVRDDARSWLVERKVNDVRVIAGHASRRKVIEIDGLDDATVAATLAAPPGLA